jgi:hypothetical protein
MGCIFPYPIHEHSDNEVETHIQQTLNPAPILNYLQHSAGGSNKKKSFLKLIDLPGEING